METAQKIKDYLDCEGIIRRKFKEILELARAAGGDPKKLDAFLERGYMNCETEQEFYTRMFEFAGNARLRQPSRYLEDRSPFSAVF